MIKILKTTIQGIHQLICIIAIILIVTGWGSSVFVIILLQRFADSYFPNDVLKKDVKKDD